MEFGILGPINAREDGLEVQLGGPKQRALLAVLLLARGDAVSRDRLIDALWGEQPPTTATHTLDAYVSRLRKLLGPNRLTRQGGGYSLRVEPGELDLDRFEELAAEGQRFLARGEACEAGAILRSASALWRGAALADLVYEPFAADAAAALEEQRLDATEARLEADLACGQSSELVGELERLVREHPFRERLLGHLMLALYRCDQQARALEVFRSGKRRLAEELGLEPARSLQELERAILQQDPALRALAPAKDARPATNSKRGWTAVGLLAAGLLLAAAWAAVSELRTPASDAVSASSNQAVEFGFDSAAPRSAVELNAAPSAMAAGFGSLWLADANAGNVVRLDLEKHAVVDRIPVGGTPATLAIGGGSVWVANIPGDRVRRIDPVTGAVTQTVILGGAHLSALAFGRGSLWVSDTTDESLLEIDPGSGTLKRTLALSVKPSALLVTSAGIWVADYDGGTITQVEPNAGSVLATIRVGTGPGALTATPGNIWVANALDSTVSRIDTKSGSVTATVPVQSGPAALISAGQWVWVANRYAGSVSRIDTTTALVSRTADLPGSPTAIAAAAGGLWVGTQSRTAHRGGTLRLLHARPITIDPALQGDLLSPVSDGLTRDSLVTYDHFPGSGGTHLVPDLALTIPVATNGGTRYSFRLRPGVRYSDGRAVRAADFRRAIERSFRLHALSRVYFTGILGASACTNLRCDLTRGIVTNETRRSVAFHLVAPDPNLLASLTTAAASPVPAGTSWRRVVAHPIPGTGPYRIAHANDEEIVWVRNPLFHEWSHAAQPAGNPDKIVLRFGLSPEREVREIETGHADALVDNIPARLLPSIQRRFPGRLHSYVIPTTDFFQFNMRRKPFNDFRVRRAVNAAIDRRAIVRLYGGSALATPTCQVLPPGVRGYRRYCPYSKRPQTAASGWWAPDLARARQLVKASGSAGDRVVVWGWIDDPTISEGVVRYVGSVLRQLGYRVEVRLLPHRLFAKQSAATLRSIQMIASGWGDTPYGYFANWFGCGAPSARGWICDPQIDRMNSRARALEATDPRAAATLWAQIDRKLVNRAAWLPMINERGLDFLSKRARNYQAHPYWGMLADQLWLT